MRTTIAIALLTLVLLAGCATPIGVEWVGADAAFTQLTTNALEDGVQSQYSDQVLAECELSGLYEENPEEAIAKLHDIACGEAHRNVFFALAELSYLAAVDTGAKEHFLAAAIYAFFYLCPEEGLGELSPYDPHFRVACELYNRALAESFRMEEGEFRLQGGDFALPFGMISVSASRPGFHWKPEEFTQFLLASEFAVRGLKTRFRNSGLGVPLIAPRFIPGSPGTGQIELPPDGVAPKIKVPATAFLRVEGTRKDMKDGKLAASLELYDTYDTADIEVRGAQPLEADLTAPLAHTLEKSQVWNLEIGGFLSSGEQDAVLGLAMIRPHVSGRIPVVLVHGTASSAARWAQMLNGLIGDTRIRERYEFWFFEYTTGKPIAYSALLLREALTEAVTRFDPEGKDAALRQMVMIGHSQGGIVTRLQAITPGDKFVSAVCTKSLDELNLTPEARDFLRRGLMFDAVPYLRRVIFLSTPHRGSFLADRWYSRLAASLVTMPGDLLDTTQQLFEKNDASVFKGGLKGVPTSIGNMTGSSPFLLAMNEIPFDPRVHVNSIIAIEGDGPPEEGNDGLVEYTSAHVDCAESEYIVRSGHSCQENLLTVMEVRRILLEHLRVIDRGATAPPATPGGTNPTP